MKHCQRANINYLMKDFFKLHGECNNKPLLILPTKVAGSIPTTVPNTVLPLLVPSLSLWILWSKIHWTIRFRLKTQPKTHRELDLQLIPFCGAALIEVDSDISSTPSEDLNKNHNDKGIICSQKFKALIYW